MHIHMIAILFVMTSCAAADYDQRPTEKIVIAKPVTYRIQEQVRAADEIDVLDDHYQCVGCSTLEKMMIDYKKLRDKNRIARGEPLP